MLLIVVAKKERVGTKKKGRVSRVFVLSVVVLSVLDCNCLERVMENVISCQWINKRMLLLSFQRKKHPHQSCIPQHSQQRCLQQPYQTATSHHTATQNRTLPTECPYAQAQAGNNTPLPMWNGTPNTRTCTTNLPKLLQSEAEDMAIREKA